jgi:hypothetical protein
MALQLLLSIIYNIFSRNYIRITPELQITARPGAIQLLRFSSIALLNKEKARRAEQLPKIVMDL